MANPFPVLDQFKQTALEEEILSWWKKEEIFKKSIQEREGAPTYSFYEGPPTANGKPGLHHVLARTIKDIFCRYNTMKGFRVERKGGWDTHGLPVEIEVEKALGLEGRHQVEDYGVEKYNAACRESVLRYKDLWDDLTVRMGYWVDLDHPYVTFENNYIETCWWLLKQLYEKDLLYQGHKIQWYSPGSGTVLSSHEVSLGYEEVQDPSVYVEFDLSDRENTAILAWTTTPWTLVSNAALAVGSNIEYSVVSFDRDGQPRNLIVATERLSILSEEYEVVETIKGSDLVGKTYRPLYRYFLEDDGADQAWRVIAADFVSTEDGTGIVHVAPAFGADDFAVGQKEGIPTLNPVAPDGTFTEKAELVSGLWFKDADKVINRDLRDRGLLYRQDSYLHNYPHDWRKGTPLMSYPVESWFVRTTKVKDRLVELNKTINWQPDGIGTGRFGQWLENNVDWALSRNRYWGTPLPIWQSDAEGSEYIEVIGSVEELREKCPDVPDDEELDLHRPFVDRYTWAAPDGGTMRRVPDLIDVWFDSGAMPFAQWHYPFENKEKFEESYPADFIAEGVDQTRGWFYTLHALATTVMDAVSFKNVVVNGFLLDEEGKKMSKTRGNAVDPFEVIAQRGADPVRWYMMSNTPPWENLKWSERGLQATERKFFLTLTNVYNFFATYANIDEFSYQATDVIPVSNRSELDRWIVSRLNSAIEETDGAYADYNPTKSARAVEGFVDDLSNWYVRRSRRRFWRTDHDDDKLSAYQTVFECLLAISKMMAPISPFYSEWLYGVLRERSGNAGPDSVHLALFPESIASDRDADLEARMTLARTASSIVLGIRNDVAINVRQPLARILVVTNDDVSSESFEEVREIVLGEVNVKAVEYVDLSSGIVDRTVAPNFKALGRRLGPLMKLATVAIKAMTAEQIGEYEQTGAISLMLDSGESVELTEGDLEVRSEGVEGWSVGQDSGLTIALDTTLTDELRDEGIAREFVNRVQKIRKDLDLDVTDRIRVQVGASEQICNGISNHQDWIRNETLADQLDLTGQESASGTATILINEETIGITVEKV